jgi:hypothetical protein
VELANPVIAIYKHYQSGLDSAIQIYRDGMTKFDHRQALTGITISEYASMPKDSLHLLLRIADSIDFFNRYSDFRTAPFTPSRLTLDLEGPRPLPADYWIYLYRTENLEHTVAIYDDSPADLKTFGDRIRRITAALRNRSNSIRPGAW